MRQNWLAAALAVATMLFVVPGQAEVTRTLAHQGVDRSYLLHNAEAAKDGPKPLLLVLHGRRKPEEANRSSAKINDLATFENFIAVYPAAIAGAWHYPEAYEPQSKVGDAATDDLGFLTALIDRLIADKLVDPARVYVSGASQGGFMTYSLICQRADRIAAASPMLASMTDAQMKACKPARAVPTMVLAGTNDRVVPYTGGQSAGQRLTSVPETLEFVGGLHGCTGQKSTVLPNAKADETTGVVQVDWTGCTIDGALRLYRVEGGGHRLPTKDAAVEKDDTNPMGRRSTAVETSETVWSFVKVFRK